MLEFMKKANTNVNLNTGNEEVDDPNIVKATLLLNRTPIPLKVKNGRFSKKITLPEGKIFVFRVMAKNQNGTKAFSPAHTVLSTNDIDILNPRPY